MEEEIREENMGGARGGGTARLHGGQFEHAA